LAQAFFLLFEVRLFLRAFFLSMCEAKTVSVASVFTIETVISFAERVKDVSNTIPKNNPFILLDFD